VPLIKKADPDRPELEEPEFFLAPLFVARIAPLKKTDLMGLLHTAQTKFDFVKTGSSFWDKRMDKNKLTSN